VCPIPSNANDCIFEEVAMKIARLSSEEELMMRLVGCAQLKRDITEKLEKLNN
jgi:hypothetical protein